jgi:phosphate-selective porin OprO/OprP
MLVKKSLMLAALGLCAIQPAVASDSLEAKTKGGFSYGTKGTDPFWFKLNGLLQADHTFISGSSVSKSTQFRTNTNLRRASVGLSGGVDNDWSYTFSLDMSSDRSFKLSDAYATYTGLHDKLDVSVGQINPSFSLENTSSSKWLAFLERSMPANAFGPVQGLGVSATYSDTHFAVAASAAAPKKGDAARKTAAGGNDNTISDQYVYSARATLAPIHEDGRVAQIGISGHYENTKDGWIEFKTLPETQTRANVSVLNTTALNGNRSIQAKNLSTYAVEIAGQSGPLYAEFEYQTARVKRTAGAGDNLKFHGYHGEVAYVLTGEHRTYNITNGTFNQIVPAPSAAGAWELAARYSYINLNNKDINGGSAHNSTLALNWYYSPAIKVSANYIRSLQTPNATYGVDKRKLNILGVRFQLVF